MTTINILYASIEGNTLAFIQKLTDVAKAAGDQLNAKLIGDETDLTAENQPYVAIVPTYLEGGTGTGPEVTEIFTNALGEYIEYAHNQGLLVGMIGSGNRNFNVQYVLTAKRYAQKYQVPLIADYELRGSKFDADKVYQKIKKIWRETA